MGTMEKSIFGGRKEVPELAALEKRLNGGKTREGVSGGCLPLWWQKWPATANRDRLRMSPWVSLGEERTRVSPSLASQKGTERKRVNGLEGCEGRHTAKRAG